MTSEVATPRLLTIAGSDSGGGAGIQADLKTFAAHGGYGMSVITAVTAQNTVEVSAIHPIPTSVVERQISAVFEDLGVDAVKIGMLASSELIRAVATQLRRYSPEHVVLDPVMVSKGGAPLLEDSAVDTLIRELLPLVTVVTPNLPEAERLTGLDLGDHPSLETRQRAAERIMEQAGGPGSVSVLIKGGHSIAEVVEDLLFHRGERHCFSHPRIHTRSTHGTGCTLSSALAAGLGAGLELPEACRRAVHYLQGAIASAPSLGNGHGPLNHLYHLFP